MIIAPRNMLLLLATSLVDNVSSIKFTYHCFLHWELGRDSLSHICHDFRILRYMLMQTYFVVRHRRHRHLPNEKKMTYFFENGTQQCGCH